MSELVTLPPGGLVNAILRVRCCVCLEEVSYSLAIPNREEMFQSLLEKRGWRLYPKIVCPECLNKKARKFIEEL